MNIRVELPSWVNEGENLPLASSFPAGGMLAPVLACGFGALDCRFDLRSVGDGWQGVANVRSDLAGQAFLKFRLSDPSRPGREWRGEVSVRFAQRQQAAPIQVIAVANEGEKSGSGQANSVSITMNGLGAGGGTAQAGSAWQSVDLFLHECDAPAPDHERVPSPDPVKSQEEPLPGASDRPSSPVVTPPTPAFAASRSDPVPATGSWSDYMLGLLAQGNSIIIGIVVLILVLVVSYLAIFGSPFGGRHVPPGPPPPDPDIAPAPAIEVDGVMPVYRDGEYFSFRVKLAKPGYLRLQTRDESGAMIQLYPSDHDTAKKLPAGQWITFPDPEVAAKRTGFGYPCYVPEGKSSDATTVRVQWSPDPFTLDGLKPAAPFYEPAAPTTWGDLATRGVRLQEGKPVVEQTEIRYEVEQ